MSESWYCEWRDRPPTAREVRRQHLAEEIEEIFRDSGGTYGSPKVFIELVRRGWRVSVNTVAKVMAELGLAGRKVRRRRSLTRPETSGVQRICRVLRVSRSGYYQWTAGAKTRQERQAADDALLVEIREIHTEHKRTYGVQRVHAEMRDFGHTVNRKRVDRLMHVNRFRAIRPGSGVHGLSSGRSCPVGALPGATCGALFGSLSTRVVPGVAVSGPGPGGVRFGCVSRMWRSWSGCFPVGPLRRQCSIGTACTGRCPVRRRPPCPCPWLPAGEQLEQAPGEGRTTTTIVTRLG
ncbi:transposase [Streptomyces sp. MUM 136J]|uniref:IS3 family transposase n=1 Tax=Streptomyces sp. MUM 136J TaxID=2791992 RepID=UPI001F04C727|nr:IS3 family transposase [Streptomyces sp. MUM 136J]MCH0572745.1 transposase [Streptomyces sp. MUM 136J]